MLRRITQLRRTMVTSAFLAFMSLSLVVMPANPAAADEVTAEAVLFRDTPINPSTSIYIYRYHDLISGFLRGPGISDITLVLRECNRPGPNQVCHTKAAVHRLHTPWKDVAGGHWYKACASFTQRGKRYVYQCSPFIAVPTR